MVIETDFKFGSELFSLQYIINKGHVEIVSLGDISHLSDDEQANLIVAIYTDGQLLEKGE